MKRALAIVQAAVLLFGTGCSLRLTRSDGRETYVGLLWMTVDPAGKTMVVHAKRLGMGLDSGDQGSGLLIGYEDSFRVTPPDDRVLHLDYRSRGPVVRVDVTGPRGSSGSSPANADPEALPAIVPPEP